MAKSSFPNSSKNIFEINKNCWRVDTAAHATLLVDCANFYSAIHQALSKAQHSIFILGWEIDSHMRLIRGDEEKNSSVPSVTLDLLNWVAKQRPEINIYLCRWDSSVVFVTDRDLMPEFVWSNNTPENVHICLDGKVPMGGSHHQKIILVDDELVFTGGMDIARQRWDKRDHKIDEPERTDVLGSYGPYHDIQIMMDGPIVKNYSELVRSRWLNACGVKPVAIRSQKDSPAEATVPTWPEKYPPQLKNIRCAIARTLPQLGEQNAVQEIRQMYLDLIKEAEEFIYIENQFLTSEEVAQAINQQLKAKPKLKALLVSSYEPQGIFERESMWAGRIEFKKVVEKDVDPSRVKMTCTKIKDKDGKYIPKRIHSKVLFIDHKFMTVASSNINHRSMVFDSECDVTLMPSNFEQAEIILFLRNDLIAEHTGRTAEEVKSIMAGDFTLLQLMKNEARKSYELYEIDDSEFTDQTFKSVVDRFADPEEPLLSYVALTPDANAKIEPFRNPRKHILALSILLLIILAVAVGYLKEHAEWFKPERLKTFLEYARHSRFALPLVCLIYVISSFFLFPVTLLSLITAAVFGALWGPIYGMLGSLASASVMFWIGNVAGHKGLRRLFGERLRAIDSKFQKAGIWGVATLRFLPIAPYSIVNLAAGISSVTFFDFLVGTFVGFLPGLVAKGLVGDSLAQVFIDPKPKTILLLGLGVLLWLALIACTFFLTRRWQKKHPA